MKRTISGTVYLFVFSIFMAGAIKVRAQHEHHGAQTKPAPDAAAHASHQALATAFHESMAVFTKTLRQNAEQSTAVNGDFARDAVAEIRRGFEQMQRHHQEHMNMLAGPARTQMEATMKQMEPHQAKVKEELEALERETGVEKPDRARILQHATELLKHLNEMSGSHHEHKGHDD